MSFHPNPMHMATSRHQSHNYGTYPGPDGMMAKPNAPGVSQMAGGAVGFPQMYFVQGAPYPAAYQSGVDGKYPGRGRGMSDPGGVIVGMAPPGVQYLGQHMQTSGAMIIPGGHQQMIVGHPPQIYQQPGAHQPHVRFAAAPPPSGQYGLGGGAGAGGGPMTQKPQQQQHQQQQYYGGGYVGGQQQQQQQSSASTVPKREKKILQFVNPDTGMAVNLGADQGPLAAPTEVEAAAAAAAAASEQTIAAQFAAQVAATLNPLSSSFGPQKTNAVASGIEEKHNKSFKATASVTQELPTASPSLEEPVASPSTELISKDPTEQLVTASSSAAVVEPFPATDGKLDTPSTGNELDTPSALPPSSGVMSAETEEWKSSSLETALQGQGQGPSKPLEGCVPLSAPVVEVDASKNVKVESAVVKDVAPAQTAQQHLNNVTPESNKVTAKSNKLTAESSKVTSESSKVTPESSKVTAESSKVTAESNKVTLESNKATSESAAESGNVSLESSSSAASDNGNKKKSRKKNKDLNSKGKVLQGTDMDAFIDGSEADEEKSKSRKSPSPTSMTAVEAAEEAAEADAVVADGAGKPQDDPLTISTSSIPDVQPQAEYEGKTRPEAENKGAVFPGDSEHGETQGVAASLLNDLQVEGVTIKEDTAAQKGDIVAAQKGDTVVAQKSEVVAAQKADTVAAQKANTAAAQKADTVVAQKSEVATAQKVDVSAAQKDDIVTAQKGDIAVAQKSNVVAAQKADVAAAQKGDIVVAQKADVTTAQKSNVVAAQKIDVAAATENDAVSAALDKSEVCLVPGKSGAGSKVSADTEVVQTPDDAKTIATGTDKDREGDDPESGTELELPASMLTKSNSKADLKYTYSEEQWSPLNPEGKKQYDRSFMLQLQFANPSIIRPAGLPCLPDIILSEPRVKNDFSRQSSHTDPSSPIDFTPGFIKQNLGGGSIGRSSVKKGGGGGGGSGMKRAAEQQQRKVINVSLEQNIMLHTSENAWKPILGKSSSSTKEGELATEELYKKIRGILNKLTPQKFQTLIQQVQHLPINTEERLTGCIDIIFEKAISEPNFSVAYANMARCLMSISVPLATDPTQMVAFRKLLLNKCQQEFEKDKAEEHDIEALESQIAEASTEEKRKALTEQRDSMIYLAKRRSLGNIRFIGELFKLKMLTEKIMHECLNKLLKSYKDEDSLECLCQLLTTIGQDIDKKQPGISIMNKYFNDLQDLIDQKKTSARIRFMIQDTIELRKNKWVPRRQNNNPKTIEQIHKEAEQEEQEKQIALQKFTQDQRNRRTTPTPNRGPPMTQNPHTSDDGWTAVGRAPKTIVDPSRMKLTKQPMDENFQLGPGGKAMSTWHRGSNGGAKAQESEKPTSTPNRFSALGGFGSESMDARSRPNNRIGSGYAGRLSGPQSRTQASKRSQERSGNEMSFRGPSAAGHSAGALSPTGSRSSSQEVRSARPSKVPMGADTFGAAGEGKEISEEEIEKKTKSLMDEYLHGHDIKEAALCVKELGSSKSLRLFVYHSLLQNLERSTQARHFTGMLHLHLVRTKQLAVDQYVEGLRGVLEFADEMTIDIPRIWEYLGELISPIIEDGSVSMAFLRVASEPLLACDKAGLVVAHVLHTAAHSLGHHKAAELWQTSGLKWTDFVKSESKDAFLQEQQLQFTEKASEAGKDLSSDQVLERLAKLLEGPDSAAEKLIDCIDDSVDEETACSTSFIRAFTSSLCSSCIILQKSPTVDQVKLKKFLPALSKYTKSRKALEVQVLYALQALAHKLEHPSGLLRAFFDTLYDEEVIGEESFNEWRSSSEASESAGKGVALQTVIQFFHWLEENEEG